jgi:hypothetical protein
MSGRWRVSSEGRLTGNSPGRVKSARVNSGKAAVAGGWPARVASRCRFWSSLQAQRRQSGARLFHLGLQRQDVPFGGRAQRQALAGQPQLFFLGRQDGRAGLDLPGQLRLNDGRGDQIADQGQARRFELVALMLGLRRQGLQRAPVAAGEVEVVTYRHAGVEQVVGAFAAGQTSGGIVDALALGTQVGVRLRILA